MFVSDFSSGTTHRPSQSSGAFAFCFEVMRSDTWRSFLSGLNGMGPGSRYYSCVCAVLALSIGSRVTEASVYSLISVFVQVWDMPGPLRHRAQRSGPSCLDLRILSKYLSSDLLDHEELSAAIVLRECFLQSWVIQLVPIQLHYYQRFQTPERVRGSI